MTAYLLHCGLLTSNLRVPPFYDIDRQSTYNIQIHQIQHERTRMNNVLDLLFVTNMNLVNNVKVYPGMSDHNCIITDINLKVKHCRKPPRTVYRFSKGNMDAVMHDLGTEFERFVRADPSSRTVDDNWNDAFRPKMGLSPNPERESQARHVLQGHSWSCRHPPAQRLTPHAI